MSPDWSHRCMAAGRSPGWTETLEAVDSLAVVMEPQPASINRASTAVSDLVMSCLTLRDRSRTAPRHEGVWQHADGLDMLHDLQAAASEYLGWLQLEANRSPNTVRAYASELNKLMGFLAANGHSLAVDKLSHDDLRAYQRHLAGRLKSPASRARALVAVRSWLRWAAREGLIARALPNGTTLPKLEQRLPKPIDPDELTRLLAALPTQTLHEKRDRALVQFLISTGCRISEALALERTDFPRTGRSEERRVGKEWRSRG